MEPLVDIMRAAQEFHPEIIRAAPQSMLRFTHDIDSGSSLPFIFYCSFIFASIYNFPIYYGIKCFCENVHGMTVKYRDIGIFSYFQAA